MPAPRCLGVVFPQHLELLPKVHGAVEGVRRAFSRYSIRGFVVVDAVEAIEVISRHSPELLRERLDTFGCDHAPDDATVRCERSIAYGRSAARRRDAAVEQA